MTTIQLVREPPQPSSVLVKTAFNSTSRVLLGSVRAGDGSHRPVLLHERLSLPVSGVPLHHRPVRAHLPHPVPQLLLSRLHQRQEASQNAPERNLPPERKLPLQKVRVTEANA